jgi:hypothetical protein
MKDLRHLQLNSSFDDDKGSLISANQWNIGTGYSYHNYREALINILFFKL